MFGLKSKKLQQLSNVQYCALIINYLIAAFNTAAHRFKSYLPEPLYAWFIAWF